MVKAVVAVLFNSPAGSPELILRKSFPVRVELVVMQPQSVAGAEMRSIAVTAHMAGEAAGLGYLVYLSRRWLATAGARRTFFALGQIARPAR